MAVDTRKAQYLLQSVGTALDVLDLLCNYEDLGVSEVAQYLEIGKSTAYRLLYTLQSKGYVKKDENSRYRLSIKFAYFGSIVLDRMEIVKLARPYLEDLTLLTNETSHLVVWAENNEVRFVDKVSSSSTIRMESFVGLKKPAYCTATGKVLLSFKDDVFLDKYLENVEFTEFTSYTIDNPLSLKETIFKIRKQGYSTDVDESEEGLTCFAAPILDPMGQALAAISVSGPTSRMLARRAFLIEHLINISGKISRTLK